MISIRAAEVGEVWVGYVEEDGRQLATVMNGFTCAQEALKGADVKRDLIQADRDRWLRGNEKRRPYWTGDDWHCTCGAEMFKGTCDNGHRWQRVGEGWERA